MTLVTSIDRGDGERILVTLEDAHALQNDTLLYGDTFIRRNPAKPWLYERIDPNDVRAAAA